MYLKVIEKYLDIFFFYIFISFWHFKYMYKIKIK